MAIVRKHIYFSLGRCRALDFVTVPKAARANDLTGWVDNLWVAEWKWKSRESFPELSV